MKEIKYSQLVNAVIFTVLLVFCLSKTREAIKVADTDLNEHRYTGLSFDTPKGYHSPFCTYVSSSSCTRSHYLQNKATLCLVGMDTLVTTKDSIYLIKKN